MTAFHPTEHLIRLQTAARLGEPVERNLEQPRCGGGDVLLLGWGIEVKRAKQASLGPWWTQAVEQAAALGCWPALAYRLDRQSWRVRLPLSAFIEAAGSMADLEWTVELSLAGFAAIIRKSYEAAPEAGGG